VSVWFDCDSCWDGFLDTAPARLELAELVPAAPAEVFEAIVDPAQRLLWSPGLLEARWLSAPPAGLGSERRLIHALLRTDQRIAAHEPARRLAVYATRSGSPALSQFMEELVLAEEPWGTRVRWRIGWRLRLPLRLLEPATLATAKRALASDLAGLRAYCDTRSAARRVTPPAR
jgi:Polyketide cyclase / dehydrase and lipid transport